MAWSTVETKIANPAQRVKRMAKRLSAKQIKFFGTARQKAALKHKRRNGAKKVRVKARAKHRKRTKPNPPKRRRVASPKKRATARKRSAPRKARRRNPVPQIIAWTAGNPAKRRSKSMPARRKKGRASARKSNAGTRRTKTRKVTRHSRRSNPGAIGRPMDWIVGGGGVVVGGFGSRLLPQLVLGPSNTGPVGYLANAVTALALGWGASMFFKKPIFTVAVIAGGFGSLIQRIVTEQTPYGAALSAPSAGLGDWGLGLYQKSNYLWPPRVQGARGLPSSNFTWGEGTQTQVGAAMGADSAAAC